MVVISVAVCVRAAGLEELWIIDGPVGGLAGLRQTVFAATTVFVRVESQASGLATDSVAGRASVEFQFFRTLVVDEVVALGGGAAVLRAITVTIQRVHLEREGVAFYNKIFGFFFFEKRIKQP